MNQTDSNLRTPQETQVVWINFFTPKPGCLDAFIELQTSFLGDTKDFVPGWRGSRLHRALDGSAAIVMAVFDSRGDHERWLQTDAFARHRAKVSELVESFSGKHYEIVCEAGRI